MPIRAAVNRPLATLMLYAGLLFFGVFAALNLPVDFLPPVQVPTLVISASYPGASPQEVRRLVAIPLEEAFASMKGIRAIDSVSRRGVASLTLGFHWGTDMTLAGVQAREVIDATYPLLPQGADRPQVLAVNPNDRPVLIVAVRAKDGDLATARSIAGREIRSALQQVEGVGSVILVGGAPREVQVRVNQARLLAAGLSVDQVASFLASENVDLPAGSFDEGNTEYLVRTNGRVSSPEAIAALRIPTPDGGSASIGDLSQVEWHPREQVSLFSVNGREAVGLLVRGRSDESPVRLSRNLKQEIARLQTAYSRSLSISIVEDGSRTILESIDGLISAGLLGAAAAFVVMLLFLRRFRPALILITAVPVSILFCLFLLWITGRSINVMSLGGIALSIGMLVDDGVVVLENLARRIRGVEEGGLRTSIVAATSEVWSSILGSTLTTIVVFLPLIFLPGLIGSLYSDLALAVIYALFASLIVSATLVPVLFLITYPRRPADGGHTLRTAPMESGYRRSLARALRRPVLVAGALLAVAVATVPLLFALRLQLVAPYDSGIVSVRIVAPPSASVNDLKRIALSASRRILALPGVASVWCRAGGESDDSYYFANPRASRETITMTVQTRYGRRPDSARVIDELRKLLVVQGARVTVGLPPSGMASLLGLHGEGYDLAVLGQTPEEALAKAQRIVKRLRRELPGARISLDEAPRISELRYTPLRDQLARAGITLASVAQTTWEDLEGAVPTKLTSRGRDYDVRVLLSPNERATTSEIRSLALRTPGGSLVQTDQVVTIGRVEAPSMLVREDRQDVAAIRLERGSASRAALTEAVAREARQRDVIDTARTIFSQHVSEIVVVLAVALLLLYLLLGAQFESFVQPLLILVAVPLATTGVIAALVFTGQTLNLSSGLGILVLLGTAVKVSIILFANYRRRVDKGVPASFAIYTGTSERLRPILISTAATVCALLPVAVNWNGLSTEDGIATAIIGGLVVSTALTLYVVPLLTWRYYARRPVRRPGATNRAASPYREATVDRAKP